jgi:hypothetical protein
MSLIVAVLLVSAQTPIAAQTAVAQAPAAKKHKAEQICEDIQLTGSRSKRHICHDANVDAGTLLGVSHSIGGKGKIDQQDGQSTGGPGGSN